MIRNSIENIQKKIRETDSLKEQDKQELLNLLSNLEAEVLSLSKTHPEQAESITGFAQVSAHEATRSKKNEQLVSLSLKGLNSSIDGFETSHEELVKIVNSISVILANMGL